MFEEKPLSSIHHGCRVPQHAEEHCECVVPEPDRVGDASDRASFAQDGPWPSAHRDAFACDSAERHLGRLFGPLEGVVHETRAWLVYVEVHLRGARAEQGYPFVDLHTAGMSQRPMNDPEARRTGLPYHAELTMQFPVEWCNGESLLEAVARPEKRWPVIWLRTLARLPHERRSYLDLGHVITFPQGAHPGCPFDGALLADAIWDEGMAVGPYIRADLTAVQLFQVVPLLPSETAFALRSGGERLLEKIEAAGANETVQLDRAAVV